MSANPLAIYDRFDPAKNYDRHLFRADKVLQSAELNEMQRAMHARLAGIAGILMKEGSIISGAGIIVNHDTGATTCESGAIYVAGAVRGVPPAALVIATVGVVFVGVYLTRDTITELEDPSLLNPAVGTDGYQEPGAARERVQLAWGVQGSGQAGEFFPVWTVEDGWVRPKEAPPNIDAVTTAIKAYDVASTGGTYIVRGMELRMAADLPTGEQVYNLGEGAARINGAALELPSGRRAWPRPGAWFQKELQCLSWGDFLHGGQARQGAARVVQGFGSGAAVIDRHHRGQAPFGVIGQGLQRHLAAHGGGQRGNAAQAVARDGLQARAIGWPQAQVRWLERDVRARQAVDHAHLAGGQKGNGGVQVADAALQRGHGGGQLGIRHAALDQRGQGVTGAVHRCEGSAQAQHVLFQQVLRVRQLQPECGGAVIGHHSTTARRLVAHGRALKPPCTVTRRRSRSAAKSCSS